MKLITKKILIGKILDLDLNLSVIEVGSGKPSIGLVTGIHGNEPEGIFVIKEVLDKLKSFKGSLKIIPCANSLGLIANQRVGAFDFMDLNRSFPGNSQGTLTEKIASVIFNEVKECDVVLDIHSVTNVGKYMGMEFGTTDKNIVEKTKQINKQLNPEVIWFSKEGSKYDNALSESLINIGVCGAGVEIPKMELLDQKTLTKIVKGIINVVKNKKVKKLEKPIPVLGNAKRYFSQKGGIYTPKMEVLSLIKKGDLVGEITDLDGFVSTNLKSEFEGVLFVQSTKKIVKSGDKIYVVAQKMGDFV